MGTRALIWTILGGAALISYWNGASTAAVVFICTAVLVNMLHALEVKLNRLLDYYGIIVTDKDIRE